MLFYIGLTVFLLLHAFVMGRHISPWLFNARLKLIKKCEPNGEINFRLYYSIIDVACIVLMIIGWQTEFKSILLWCIGLGALYYLALIPKFMKDAKQR